MHKLATCHTVEYRRINQCLPSQTVMIPVKGYLKFGASQDMHLGFIIVQIYIRAGLKYEDIIKYVYFRE